MTVNSEAANHSAGVINLNPLKKSASFTISVDRVEVKPAKIYSKPLEDVGEGEEEWSGEEEDEVEEVIIPGTDWESVNYVYKKFPAEVGPHPLSEEKFANFDRVDHLLFIAP